MLFAGRGYTDNHHSSAEPLGVIHTRTHIHHTATVLPALTLLAGSSAESIVYFDGTTGL